MPSENVVQLLFEAMQKSPARVALVAGGESITFEQLWRRVSCAGHGLLEHGFGRGDRAIVMVPMSIELYVLLLAILKVGGIAVFLDPWVGFRQLVTLAKFAQPQAFAGGTKSHLLRLFDKRLRAIRLRLSIGWSPLANTSLRKLERSTPRDDIAIVSPEDTALITYTTGSSGTPKGVRRTHRILTAQHLALAEEFPAAQDDVDLCTFPVFALNNLALGVTTVIPPVNLANIGSAHAFRVADVIASAKVRTITASPPLVDALANIGPKEKGSEQSGLDHHPRRILTGGAPVSDAQLRRWRAAFPNSEIEVVYGSTEAEPVAHISADERLKAPKRSGYLTGEITPRVKAKLVRISHGPLTRWANLSVDPGEAGELIVAGDHVCKDYDRNEEAVRENKIVDEEGTIWHRMGDTGYFDEEKRFWLVGRVHSTIITNGVMLHAQLLEQIAMGESHQVDETSGLSGTVIPSEAKNAKRSEAESRDPLVPGRDVSIAMPPIRRAAAIGMAHLAMGQRALIVVESDGDVGDLIKHRLEEAGYPGLAVIVTKTPIPLDPRHNSKVDYGRLREMLTEGKIQ